MKTLKFLKDSYVDGQLVYASGKTYEVSDDTGSASRWIKRGHAVVVDSSPVFQKQETLEEAPQAVNTIQEESLSKPVTEPKEMEKPTAKLKSKFQSHKGKR